MHKTKAKIINSACLAVSLLFLLICSSCVFVSVNHSIRGNGIVKTKLLPQSNFDAVSIGGDWTADIRYSETFSVTVDADENLFPYLDIYVSNNTLHIGFKRGFVIDSDHCRAFITMPVLTQLTASGSLTASISSFNSYGETMSIVISGSGDVTASDIAVRSLRLKISGSGSFSAAGEAVDMTAVISGSGDIKTTDLETANTEISISGSGSAKVWVTRLLTADISGTGSVRYKGDPVVVGKISGLGRINPL